jgi:ribosomal protein S6--L-glutamate ligase
MSIAEQYEDSRDARQARAGRRPRIAIAAEHRYLSQLQPAGLAIALLQAGHEPAILEAQNLRGASLIGIDLLVARGRSPALLALLERAEALDVPTINRRAAITAVVDKASMAKALAAARIPTPPTRVGTLAALARASSSSDFPMVVKPVFGDNARGVRVVHAREDLATLPWSEPIALAQPFIPSDGFDLKLYVAGPEVHAVRKPSPIASAGGAAVPVPVTPALRALALRCGLLFGLELYGVDCIATPEGAVVIEVNDFPNYSGIDGVNERLARYAIARACRSAGCGEQP